VADAEIEKGGGMYTLVPECAAELHGKVWRIEPPHKVCSFSKFTYLSRFLATH